ncbi:MAG: hypothetical protein JXQ73_09230 [Phycisphaerae bacterium]|nr:hypothetical protein [Phycisphaerae bacterium]
MCDSCRDGLTRRQFIVCGSLAGPLVGSSLVGVLGGAEAAGAGAGRSQKSPAVVKALFLYPQPEDCDQGKAEASWQEHHWHPYPGNQYRHAEQQAKFTQKVGEMGKRIGMRIDFAPKSLKADVEVDRYIAETKPTKPDATLIFCLSSASAGKAHKIAQQIDAPAIVYLPTGASHHRPPEQLTKTKGLHFIHSIENWEEIERSLRAVHAKKMLGQSRVLRVGNYDGVKKSTHGRLGTEVVAIPAGEYNSLFDSIVPDEGMKRAAMQFKQGAAGVTDDVTDHYFVEAFRAHKAVGTLLERYNADGITIACLMLQHRKPCVSFSINNGELTATCGCENDITATMTMLLNRYLFGRAGFQHNSEYDEVRNHYFATHCTCATKLNGPDAPAQAYKIRPFFHHLPKTPALDVQWTPNAPVILSKMLSEKEIRYWCGRVIGCPTCPPTGGCATRVLVDFDVDDVNTVYVGSHPILSVGGRDDARCYGIFSKLFEAKSAAKT